MALLNFSGAESESAFFISWPLRGFSEMASLTPKTMAVTVRLDRQESDQLDRLASREREARSIVIRRLLRQGSCAKRVASRRRPAVSDTPWGSLLREPAVTPRPTGGDSPRK